MGNCRANWFENAREKPADCENLIAHTFDLLSAFMAPPFKIPHIKAASELANGKLRLFAVPWAAPAWMKSNGRMAGEGQLKGDLEGPYYRTYAHYLKRYMMRGFNVIFDIFWHFYSIFNIHDRKFA